LFLQNIIGGAEQFRFWLTGSLDIVCNQSFTLYATHPLVCGLE